jgi:nitroimidazol reductase NimA-like FMN-containing flavoprotein (pyridoxamine 5'-phosphate oxidase superfamily)
MPSLSRPQIDEFLTGGRHLMRLSTLTPEGWPYVNPVWYHYDGESFLVAGRTKAQWVDHIRTDGRVSACIDTSERSHTRVLVEGTAVVADAAWLGDWKAWAIRYLGQEAGHRYYEETRHIPRALVRIAPRKLTSWTGPGWHPRYTE